MIYSLKGKLALKETNLAVVDCGGVGYGCKTSYNTVSRLGSIGSEVMLYTSLQVREDSVELFGFLTQQELNCFKMLISVSGVGPKAAVSILSDMDVHSFAFAVASGDSKAFTRTKGVGAKTAQRIVLELKDKISSESLTGSVSSDMQAYNMPSASVSASSVSEALEALMVLGYSQSEVVPVLRKLDPSLNTQDLIKEALKAVSSR
ncbi:MAG: Holliday junction branch migration protein RuvA [Ruminococcus sp.]|nr:Holliday junction branch migration protein RuvA [Ruminococcus sp.]